MSYRRVNLYLLVWLSLFDIVQFVSSFKIQYHSVKSSSFAPSFILTDLRVQSKSIASATSNKGTFDFKALEKLLQDCKNDDNSVIYVTQAVEIANSLLAEESTSLTSYQISIILKCFGAAAMVDDAVKVLDR